MRSPSRFENDPLGFLDQAFASTADAVWAGDRQLLVGSAAPARAVLTNTDDLYEEHSDFFHTRKGMFGTRDQQVEIGRASMALIRAHLRSRVDTLPASIETHLVPESDWPDAGNRLVYDHLAPILVSPERPASLRRILDQIVERAVLAGARERHSWLARWIFRQRAMGELKRVVVSIRRQRPGAIDDVLGAIVETADPEVDAGELAEVFLSFLFAAAGSVGFTLAWSLYLLGRHPETKAPPAWVVREALRLWPVAWLLGRRPARSHAVGEVEVTETDHVVVCPYAVHRNARHWNDPHDFRPERWGETHDTQAFLAFGWGPRRCVGASSSMRLVEDILRILDQRYTTTTTFETDQPTIAAALAPPRFRLRLEALESRTKGGDRHA